MASNEDECRPTSDWSHMDTSAVKSPLLMGSTGLKQLLQCYQAGTDEIRHTLMQECDVIIECKVCRSLYRGLPNFFSHKQHYCKNPYAGTLVRFQGMPQKEDETFVFGSSVFLAEENDNEEVQFGRRSRRPKPDTPFSQTYNYFKNIDKVGQNINTVKSSDNVIQLDLIEGNQNAVKQNLTSTKDIPKEWKDQSRKRKAEDNMSGEGHKFPRLSNSKDIACEGTGLNGVLTKSVTRKIYSLRQFFVRNKLVSMKTNRCLKCESDYSSYKSLKCHMKRSHMKKKLFFQCNVCSKLYLHGPKFQQHLLTAHSTSKGKIPVIMEKSRLEMYVFDNRDVYHIPVLKHQKNISHQSESLQEVDEAAQATASDEEYDPVLGSGGQSSDVEDQKNDKRGYFCTKTFFSAIVGCIGIGSVHGKPKKYLCKKHPSLQMTDYNRWREHLINEHCKQVITCPLCTASFTRNTYDNKQISSFAKHLKTSHEITESNVGKIAGRLQACMLNEVDSSIKVEGTEEQDELVGKEASVKISTEVKEPAPKPRGTTEYGCVKCHRTYPMFMTVKRHMMLAHGMGNKECNDLRATIEKNAFFKPFRRTLRTCPQDMEGGIQSTFNLEDYFCPLCNRNYPKLTAVTGHLQQHHGLDKEEANQFKPEIKQDFEKRRKDYLLSLSTTRSVYRSEDPFKAAGDDAEDGEHPEPQRRTRKQNVPAKSVSPATETKVAEPVASTAKAPLSSTFSLQRCSNCQKIFGKKASLEAHQKKCLQGEEASVSSDEEEQQLSGSSQKKDSLTCPKCNRQFLNRAGKGMHEKTCRGIKEESDSDDESSDKEEVKSAESTLLRSMLTSAYVSGVGTCDEGFASKSQKRSHQKQCSGQSSRKSALPKADDRSSEKQGDQNRKNLMETDENKNCDKTKDQDRKPSRVMYKVYKCPLCDIEDLELHRISHHLVTIHNWSSAKVAARRDTLKRSVVFKSCKPHRKPPSEDSSDPTYIPHSGESSTQSDDGADVKTLSDSALGELNHYACSMCPKVYLQIWKLTSHWQICHGQDQTTIAKMKKEVLDKRRQQLAELRGLQRPQRSRAADNDSTSVNSEGSSSQGTSHSTRSSPKKVDGHSPETKVNASGFSVKPMLVGE